MILKVVDDVELLDSARAEVLVGTGVDVAMNLVVVDDVDASTLMLTAVAYVGYLCRRSRRGGTRDTQGC